MQFRIFTASVFIAVIGSLPAAKANEPSKPAPAGDAWFEPNSTPSNGPTHVPDVPASGLPPAGGEQNPAASSPRWVPSPLVPSHPPMPPRPDYSAPPLHEVRFEPAEPSLRLLTLSGEVPYEPMSVVHYGWRGWWGPQGLYQDYGVAPVYAPLCAGPCTLRLHSGPQQWAIAKPGARIVPIETPINIAGPSTVRADYVDRSGLRETGVAVGVVGMLSGLAMMLGSVHTNNACQGNTCETTSAVDAGWMTGGIVVFVSSIIASAVLLNQHDETHVSVSPLHVKPIDLRAGSDRNAWGNQPQGAELSLGY